MNNRSVKTASHCILNWAQRLQALAQTALAHPTTTHEGVRCEEIQKISAELFSSIGSISFETTQERLSAERGYATPKVGARAAVFQNIKPLAPGT